MASAKTPCKFCGAPSHPGLCQMKDILAKARALDKDIHEIVPPADEQTPKPVEVMMDSDVARVPVDVDRPFSILDLDTEANAGEEDGSTAAEDPEVEVRRPRMDRRRMWERVNRLKHRMQTRERVRRMRERRDQPAPG